MGRNGIIRKKSKRKIRGKAREYLLVLMALFAAAVLNAAADGIPAKAQDCRGLALKGYNESPQCRYYKSILIEPGDTLWEIALEFKDARYGSTQEYVDELMEINGLTSDRIHAGRFLTVSYYQ